MRMDIWPWDWAFILVSHIMAFINFFYDRTFLTEFKTGKTDENADGQLWKGEGGEREETLKLDAKVLPSLDYILAGKRVSKYVASIKEASNGANLFGFVEQRDQQVLLSLELLQGHGSIGKLQLQAIELPVETQLVTFLFKLKVSRYLT